MMNKIIAAKMSTPVTAGGMIARKLTGKKRVAVTE
jgi:hypothetical protein